MKFKEFENKVRQFKNYHAEYSKENNRVFIFKDDEPECVVKIFLERNSKYMVFDVNTPNDLLNLIADYTHNLEV